MQRQAINTSQIELAMRRDLKVSALKEFLFRFAVYCWNAFLACLDVSRREILA